MKADILIKCDELDQDELQKITYEIVRTINDETDLEATIAKQKGKKGRKGDAISIGQIVLTALSSGTIVALFGVLKSYFERKAALKLEFIRKDSKKLSITAENLSSTQIDQTIKLAQNFFED